mgnify:CR=1 FL=1
MSETEKDEALRLYRAENPEIAGMVDDVLAAPAVHPMVKSVLPGLMRDMAYLTRPRLVSPYLKPHPTDPKD